VRIKKVLFPSKVGFNCKNCGSCCQLQPPDANYEEQQELEAKGFSHFLGRHDHAGIRWVRRKQDGSCLFLGKDNKCTAYESRPSVCRLEPFTIADYDYENDTIMLDLNFPSAYACPGLTDEDGALPTESIAKAAVVVVRKIVELTAKDLDLKPSDVRVLAETRSRILRRQVDLAHLSF
jgi:Fe-S-cluster containining protein